VESGPLHPTSGTQRLEALQGANASSALLGETQHPSDPSDLLRDPRDT